MISVIIPVYNTETYIRHCLDSVAGQTYRDLEILLIDDGSTDGCPAICDEYAENDSRFKVWHCQNSGVSHARNIGLEYASGEWVCFVDSDDWIASNMFESMIEVAGRTKVKTVCCGAFEGDENGVVERNIWRRFDGNEHIYEGVEVLAAIIEQSATLWNKLLWGDCARKLRFDEDIRFAEDALFLTKYLEDEIRATVIKRNLYYYRSERAGNVVSAALNERHLDLVRATGMIYELLVKHGVPVVGVERVVDVIVRVLSIINEPKAQNRYIQSVKELALQVSPDAKRLLDRGKNIKQLAKYIMLCLARRGSAVAVYAAKLLMMIK